MMYYLMYQKTKKAWSYYPAMVSLLVPVTYKTLGKHLQTHPMFIEDILTYSYLRSCGLHSLSLLGTFDSALLVRR